MSTPNQAAPGGEQIPLVDPAVSAPAPDLLVPPEIAAAGFTAGTLRAMGFETPQQFASLGVIFALGKTVGRAEVSVELATSTATAAVAAVATHAAAASASAAEQGDPAKQEAPDNRTNYEKLLDKVLDGPRQFTIAWQGAPRGVGNENGGEVFGRISQDSTFDLGPGYESLYAISRGRRLGKSHEVVSMDVSWVGPRQIRTVGEYIDGLVEEEHLDADEGAVMLHYGAYLHKDSGCYATLRVLTTRPIAEEISNYLGNEDDPSNQHPELARDLVRRHFERLLQVVKPADPSYERIVAQRADLLTLWNFFSGTVVKASNYQPLASGGRQKLSGNDKSKDCTVAIQQPKQK